MSLKHFAMLATSSYSEQQQLYNHTINTNTSNSTITTAMPATLNPITSESLTRIINNKKTALIQLDKQQQLAVASTLSSNTTSKTTTTITSNSLSDTSKSSALIPPQPNPLYSDSDASTHDHINGIGITSDLSTGSSSYSDDDDDVDGSVVSSEALDPIDSGQEASYTPSQQHHSNTYTSTTYYGSGFGVFHQQNMRSNGGGIALITGNSGNSGGLGSSAYSNGINNNVNLLLGGAMLTLITTILCVVCYCCHRNIKKRTEAAYRQQRQWLENDPNMEIYSVEQCYETSGLFVGDSMDALATIPALHHEPPPSYDAVVAMQEQQQLLMQQQHLLMQQQLMQHQQLSENNSPPPGYRSSLDVSSILPQQRSAAGLGSITAMGSSIISGMDVNSLSSSTANIGTASRHSPVDPLMNYNDVNGNMATNTTQAGTAATLTNNNVTINFLRNKQPQQQQRNIPSSQLSQLNMKKVLQAQSCCSLQRAEVENMWNAAAAALAARSTHIPNDIRSTTASTAASTSSPTLAMNVRKLSNAPETFGSRYLKQNYYRRGCPLCGKFRYDNDSQLSISMESNLDTLQGANIGNSSNTNASNNNDEELLENDLNGNDNNSENLHSISDSNKNNNMVREKEAYNSIVDPESETDDNEMEEEIDEDECETVEQQCSCSNSRQISNKAKFKKQNLYQQINLQQNNNDSDHDSSTSDDQNRKESQTISNASDSNANSTLNIERQSTTNPVSNNNNNFFMELPSTSSGATAINAANCAIIDAPERSPSSVTINLDCINENGIISLDMSKIIDKTGLPTYDAAIKLESSGYV